MLHIERVIRTILSDYHRLDGKYEQEYNGNPKEFISHDTNKEVFERNQSEFFPLVQKNRLRLFYWQNDGEHRTLVWFALEFYGASQCFNLRFGHVQSESLTFN